MPLVFFTDRDLGQRFPDILRAAGIQVERHCDHFADDAPDVQWIVEVASRGWIGVTHDKAISRRPNERDTVLEAGLGLLIMVGAAPYAELANNFVVTLPRITTFVQKHHPPFIARVYRPTPAEMVKRRKPIGRVEYWLP